MRSTLRRSPCAVQTPRLELSALRAGCSRDRATLPMHGIAGLPETVARPHAEEPHHSRPGADRSRGHVRPPARSAVHPVATRGADHGRRWARVGEPHRGRQLAVLGRRARDRPARAAVARHAVVARAGTRLDRRGVALAGRVLRGVLDRWPRCGHVRRSHRRDVRRARRAGDRGRAPELRAVGGAGPADGLRAARQPQRGACAAARRAALRARCSGCSSTRCDARPGACCGPCP